MVSDPLEATVNRLVEAVVQAAARVETIEVHNFDPRPAARAATQGDPPLKGVSAVTRRNLEKLAMLANGS